MQRTLAWLSLLSLAVYASASLLRTHERRRQFDREGKGEPLQVWEGEGGGVPVPDKNRMAAQISAEPLRH